MQVEFCKRKTASAMPVKAVTAAALLRKVIKPRSRKNNELQTCENRNILALVFFFFFLLGSCLLRNTVALLTVNYKRGFEIECTNRIKILRLKWFFSPKNISCLYNKMCAYKSIIAPLYVKLKENTPAMVYKNKI